MKIVAELAYHLERARQSRAAAASAADICARLAHTALAAAHDKIARAVDVSPRRSDVPQAILAA